MSERARASHPRLSSLLDPFLDGITRHLVIGICFFHSDDSHRILSESRLETSNVSLEPVLNPATSVILRRFELTLATASHRPDYATFVVVPRPPCRLRYRRRRRVAVAVRAVGVGQPA